MPLNAIEKHFILVEFLMRICNVALLGFAQLKSIEMPVIMDLAVVRPAAVVKLIYDSLGLLNN